MVSIKAVKIYHSSLSKNKKELVENISFIQW